MKILYDHQIFEAQVYGGVSRYFYELMRCLAQNHKDAGFELPLVFSNNHYLKHASFAGGKYKKITGFDNFLVNFNFRGKWKLYQIAKKAGLLSDHSGVNRACSTRRLTEQEFDVFHPTYYDPYFLEYIGKKPFVLTVYDMIHELFPHEYKTEESVAPVKKLLVEKASKIIAISESTKRDMIRIYGCEEDRIQVVYLGNSLSVSSNDARKIKTPRRYVLFVGSRGRYKNFSFFLESIAPLLKKDPELMVVCAGGGAFGAFEIDHFKALELDGRVWQYSIDDDTLSTLYRNAVAFIFPSLYEGFGIPVLESFAAGCPLIVSNSSSLPEVAGEAAVYIDPKDGLSIRDAVEKVSGSEKLREELRVKGFEQLKKFSWEAMAQKTKKIYESVIK